MRVCLVSQEYPPETAHGGIGTQTWNKAETLTRLGHTVHVLSCAARPGPDPRTETVNGITVQRMQPPERDFAVYEQGVYLTGYSWSVARHLARLQETTKFDIVNFPEYGAEGYVFQLNRTPWNWVPIVVQLHGPLAMFAERIGWPDRESAFYRIGTFMEDMSIKLADRLMASSANIADFAASFHGVPRDSIDVVHCGIDVDAFSPGEDVARDRTGPTILFVGNLAANKGLKTVAEATLRLRPRYPDLQLHIVGKGDDDVGPKLLARARQAGAEGSIRFHGFVKDRARLPALYRAADVFCSPAYHEVGVANVYVEAMACGTPVVASSTGGAPEAVSDGEHGLLVPPNDAEATAAALDRLLGDRALRDRLGRGARRRAVAYFARDKYIARVLAAYERAIENSQEKHSRMKDEGC